MKMISFKVVAERMKQYVAWVQFVLILYLFIAESPYPFWIVLPVAGVGVLLIGYIDYKFIFPKEIGKVASKNPFLVNLQNDITEIKEKICQT